tara:strand:- start:88 stop:990 length:903 start_codon:yes stop_codon:yes gene_type:complete
VIKNLAIKFLSVIFILICSTSIAFSKWKYNPGDIVKGEIIFGNKDKFKLPPGEFTVGVVSREQEFRDIMLYQIDNNTGFVRWALHLYATGRTKWDYWNQSEWCERTNVYFIKQVKANKAFSCWMVNHTRSDISANKGFWAKVREYEIANNLKNADILVYTSYVHSKGSKLWGWGYFYNPELDGVPKAVNLEWDTSEFHKQRVKNHPKHEEFLKKFINISAAYVDAFNINRKMKDGSKLTLNVKENLSNSVSINSESSVKNSKKEKKGSVVEELKSLKDLLDSGAITKDEFDKAKKKLLSN